MPRSVKKAWNRSAVVAYGCILAALVLLLGITVRCSWRDYRVLQSDLLKNEVAKLRSHADRTVGRIERELETQPTTDLLQLTEQDWLKEYWKREFSRDGNPQYGAILAVNGMVIWHSDKTRIDSRLSRQWYNRMLEDIGTNVFETRSRALTAGDTALDVRVPIVIKGVEVGEYHSGFGLQWLTEAAVTSRAGFVQRRLISIFAVTLMVGLAVASLYYIATHSVIQRRVIDRAYVERNAEMSQLAAGLAHEIRNPLHAIRLNLHTFQRAQNDQSRISADEVGRMLDQSSREIERIDRLMQALVGFATPEEAREEEIDLSTEIHSVVDFIKQEMVHRNIELNTRLAQQSISVRMDPGRFRQIMLNLIHNAADALDDGGHIEITLVARGGFAEMAVADDGPGISDADRKRVFEPFFTTKNNGTGLGLALVKRFVEEADGEIHCESSATGGTTFRILLPDIPKLQKRFQRR